MRVPSHKKNKGNREADTLAKMVVITPFTGLEPFYGLSTHVKEKFWRCELNQLHRYWNNVSGQRQAKKLISLSPKKDKQFLDLNTKI